uniref:Odorant-binding protein 2 n=1 Tax=Eocanthecona furcellata TaxID=696902 RepID=A0AAT9TYL9_9HEMI
MAATYLVSLLVSATCFFGAFADPVIKDPLAFKNATWAKCQKQENAPDDVMKEFYFFTSTDRLTDYKCVVKCIQEEYGFFLKDGTLNMNLVEKTIKGMWKDPEVQQKLIMVVDKCKNSDPQGTHKCQKNFDLLDCFIKNTKKGKINMGNRKN